MKYSVDKLAKLAGISARTLRYYDHLGLLVPKRDLVSNYRYYDSEDSSVLQYILISKQMGLSLNEIKSLIRTQIPSQKIGILTKHLVTLNEKQKQLNLLLKNVEDTILTLKGELTMSDQKKFEGLKDELIRKNDETYKDEVISKWGKNAYEKSIEHYKKMSKETFDEMNNLGNQIILKLQMIKKEPGNEQLKKEVAQLHKAWITMAWGSYQREIHLNVVTMYVEDERFKKYYDKHGDGLAKNLKDAVFKYI